METTASRRLKQKNGSASRGRRKHESAGSYLCHNSFFGEKLMVKKLQEEKVIAYTANFVAATLGGGKSGQA
jgi:hypothetical protein